MANRQKGNAEKRARRQEARAKVTQLRERLRVALAAKKSRMRELSQGIRAERAALRERLRENYKGFLDQLRQWEKDQRRAARDEWQKKRREARDEAESEIARVRAELAAGRAHEAEARRITREARARAATHVSVRRQTDEEVRALSPPQLVPLFERLKRSIQAGPSLSRAEAFLALAAARPEDVFKLIEPRVEEMIRATVDELARAARAAIGAASRDGAARTPARVKPANSNALPGGGPLREETERLAEIEQRAAEKMKTLKAPEVRDTAQIAKLIREDIKAAVKKGELPKATYSVRTDKYSMGSSIDVVVSKLPFPVINADAYRVDREATYATFDSSRFRSRFTPRAQEVERKLEAIVDAYHWDRSDSMTDYHNERFSKDIRLTENAAEWKKIEAAKVAAARADEGRAGL